MKAGWGVRRACGAFRFFCSPSGRAKEPETGKTKEPETGQLVNRNHPSTFVYNPQANKLTFVEMATPAYLAAPLR